MNVSYDSMADAVYIDFFNGKRSVAYSVEVTDDIVIDYDFLGSRGLDFTNVSAGVEVYRLQAHNVPEPWYSETIQALSGLGLTIIDRPVID